ncbi:MAG: hypothetical protein HWD59_00350 [Coxiellaceae bacterium]|nr:MAG: hypothetical protein HWD59_00350 [Coxiellaceae bacterium]
MQLLADKNPLILYYAAMKMLACLHPRDDNPEVIKLTVVLLSVAHVLSKQDHLLAYIANLSLNHSLTGNYMIDVNVHYFNLFSARLGVNLSDARNNTTELQLILPSLQFILAQVSSKFYQKLPVLVHLLGKFGITGTLNLAPILRQVMHYSTDADYIKAKLMATVFNNFRK